MIVCEICGKEFNTNLALAGHKRMHGNSKGKIENIKCSCVHTRKELLVRNLDKYHNRLLSCKHCTKLFSPRVDRKLFCNRSCSATYNNKNKKHGTRRSKLEKICENYLIENYSYNFQFNQKNIIGSELDIYIPELSVAFELQGPFHFYAIYGEEKFQNIKKNDNEKRLNCIKHNITLIEIDTRDYYKDYDELKIFEIIKSHLK